MFPRVPRGHAPIYILTAFLGGSLVGACQSPSQSSNNSGSFEPSLTGRGLGGAPPTVTVAASNAPQVSGLPLQLCSIDGQLSAGDVSGSLVIDNFDDGDASFVGNGLKGYWFAYGDGTGEQSPGSNWMPKAPGALGTAFAASISGSGYVDWGSGNSSVFSSRGGGDDCLFDASMYDGVTFMLRGSITVEPSQESLVAEEDRGKVRLQIPELEVVPIESGGTCDPTLGSCWNSHRMRIAPTECFRRVAVRFADMTQDSWGQKTGALSSDQIYQIGFEVAAHQIFDFQIDEIEFFVGEPPPLFEDCGGAGGAGGAAP